MPSKSIDLVIFDCDGVLVDSEPIANRVFAAAITEAGLPTTYEDSCRKYMGLSMPSAIERIEAELGRRLPDGWLDTVQYETMAAFKRDLLSVAGVEDVIRSLIENAVPICVASSGRPEKMAVTLGHTKLDRYFDGRIFSASEVARGKPHPDLFLHAADRMGVSPAACVVVEDSVPGITGAVAAGMRAFAYAGNPVADEAALKGAGGIIVRTMKDLQTELDDSLGLR